MAASCCKETWQKIPDDEPVFILRGKDLLAPSIVVDWIEKAEEANVNSDKIQRAWEHYKAMIEFQAQHPSHCKIPD